MKITIVNGVGENNFPPESKSLQNTINRMKTDHELTHFDITKLNIKPCTGCWTCWVKDPGNCVLNDDMIEIYKSIVKSDMLIFVSSIKAGFITSHVKMAIERMFALLLPYMQLVKGEFHHVHRYENNPLLGLVIVGEEEHDTEQEEILKEYIYRLSLNFNDARGSFLHYFNPECGKELINEVNSI